jgi:hypothetical protein
MGLVAREGQARDAEDGPLVAREETGTPGPRTAAKTWRANTTTAAKSARLRYAQA